MVRRFVPLATLLALLLLAVTPAFAAEGVTNTIDLKTKKGDVVIKLRPDLAPKHVKQIQALVAKHFYDGIVFHRVIPGFMAQGGDRTGTGSGGSKLPDLPAEFTNKRRFLRGICGMARTSDPNSGNSQFFIMFAPAPSLDGNYTIWGQVVSGMEYVDKIKSGSSSNNGAVSNPDRIVRMRPATDS